MGRLRLGLLAIMALQPGSLAAKSPTFLPTEKPSRLPTPVPSHSSGPTNTPVPSVTYTPTHKPTEFPTTSGFIQGSLSEIIFESALIVCVIAFIGLLLGLGNIRHDAKRHARKVEKLNQLTLERLYLRNQIKETIEPEDLNDETEEKIETFKTHFYPGDRVMLLLEPPRPISNSCCGPKEKPLSPAEKALFLEGDLDGDGIVTAEELSHYTKDFIRGRRGTIVGFADDGNNYRVAFDLEDDDNDDEDDKDDAEEDDDLFDDSDEEDAGPEAKGCCKPRRSDSCCRPGSRKCCGNCAAGNCCNKDGKCTKLTRKEVVSMEKMLARRKKAAEDALDKVQRATASIYSLRTKHKHTPGDIIKIKATKRALSLSLSIFLCAKK